MNKDIEQRLVELGNALIDQNSCRIIAEPKQRASGFWFGGGKLIRLKDGRLCLSGRYRNSGDSRGGLKFGERGAELALFTSDDNGLTWEMQISLRKEDLVCSDAVPISIEGTALHETDEGVELYISTEKGNVEYPEAVQQYKKPGSGVWSIDVIRARTIEQLAHTEPSPLIYSADSQFLHVKDPFIYSSTSGNTYLFYCTHPFCWSSSSTAYLNLKTREHVLDVFPRGHTWDVAIARGTSLVRLPNAGVLKDLPPAALLFYDGGECLRNHHEHAVAVSRPRGYSCEELGGLAYMTGDDVSSFTRLSVNFPLFVSPYGTGCSRYTDVLVQPEGLYAVWQQSQPDCSQALVFRFLPMKEVENILS